MSHHHHGHDHHNKHNEHGHHHSGHHQNEEEFRRPGIVYYGEPATQGADLYAAEYDTHYFHIAAGLGSGTNNYAEIMSLRLLLIFALEQGCRSLQIFGDSRIVIDWANEHTRCNVMVLSPILEDVLRLKQIFNLITFTHVYRERNGMADLLSKEATQQRLDLGTWRITLYNTATSYSYYHLPFNVALEDRLGD